MIGELFFKDDKEKLRQLSDYQPSAAVGEITLKVKNDYSTGHENINRSFRELNDESVITRKNIDQARFNAYVEPKSDDPEDSWRWNGVRPLARFKMISIAAHTTASLLYPKAFAQNDNDEEDEEGANIMQDMIAWNIRNSKYEISYLYGVIGALTNPCVYLGAEYAEVMQTIRERDKNGELTKTEVIDEVLSGFQTHVIPTDEILIANPYQYFHQKQRFTVRRKFIDYDEAKAKYGEHPNWEYLKPGVKALYNEDDGLFYDQASEELATLCEDANYRNRREDIEIPFVNGIYFGDDDTENNPMKHRDFMNRPKYAEAKSGYGPIDEMRFYYYKSAAFELGNDDDLVNAMWRVRMNMSILAGEPPVGISGDDQIDQSVMFPGSVVAFGDKDTKMTTLMPNVNFAALDSGIGMVEKSMSEGSQSDGRMGISTEGETAYARSKDEQNAQIKLGLFERMNKELVNDFGELMVDIIVNHQTVGEVEELTGGQTRMKFRSFLLPDQNQDGKLVTKRIEFTEDLIGRDMTDKEKRKKSFELMEKEEKSGGKVRLIKANPYRFRNLKYMLSVEADDMLAKNEMAQLAFSLRAYDRMITNPYVEGEAVTRDYLVKPFAKGETDKYMKDSEKMFGNDSVFAQIAKEKGGRQVSQPKTTENQIVDDNALNSMIANV